jgi:hypothetical protein
MQVEAFRDEVVVLYAPLLVFLPWLVLNLGLNISPRGRKYIGQHQQERQAQYSINAQPTAISIAGLVFAALAFVGSAKTSAIAEPLLLSLCCFVALYATAFWPWSFQFNVLGDGLEWTGLSLFTAGTFRFAQTIAGVHLALWALALTSLFLLVLSWRGTVAQAKGAYEGSTAQ